VHTTSVMNGFLRVLNVLLQPLPDHTTLHILSGTALCVLARLMWRHHLCVIIIMTRTTLD
jgi:hypothetical protein